MPLKNPQQSLIMVTENYTKTPIKNNLQINKTNS